MYSMMSSASESEISEEEGEDAYCYRGKACLTKESLKDLVRQVG